MIDCPSTVALTVIRTLLLPQINSMEVAKVMVISLLAATSQSQPSSVVTHSPVVSVMMVPMLEVGITDNVPSD